MEPQGAGRDGTGMRPQLDQESVDLIELLGLTEEQFRRRFRGTALMRSKRRGLLRNAALVLGNVGDERALPALRAPGRFRAARPRGGGMGDCGDRK